jgi:hypothetical protein
MWGILAIAIPVFVGFAMAGSGHGDKSMDHQKMEGEFKHHMTTEGVKAEFQIMSLASMNMKDADGATHHIMVKFMNAESGAQIKEAVGRIKVISPSKKETVVDLKDYSGIYAANVTFEEAGKYGVICLAKVGGQKPLYKFWYSHHK